MLSSGLGEKHRERIRTAMKNVPRGGLALFRDEVFLTTIVYLLGIRSSPWEPLAVVAESLRG
jgi:hypothetical protein